MQVIEAYRKIVIRSKVLRRKSKKREGKEWETLEDAVRWLFQRCGVVEMHFRQVCVFRLGNHLPTFVMETFLGLH